MRKSNLISGFLCSLGDDGAISGWCLRPLDDDGAIIGWCERRHRYWVQEAKGAKLAKGALTPVFVSAPFAPPNRRINTIFHSPFTILHSPFSISYESLFDLQQLRLRVKFPAVNVQKAQKITLKAIWHSILK